MRVVATRIDGCDTVSIRNAHAASTTPWSGNQSKHNPQTQISI